MIRNLLCTVMLGMAVSPLFGQEQTDSIGVAGVSDTLYSDNKYKVETNTFWNNCFVSVGGGAQMFFSDHNKQLKFGHRFTPALDVAVGKWFTPGFGLRVMYSGLSAKGATQNDAHSNGKPIGDKPWQGYWLKESKFDFFNLHADVMFNFSNLFFGYNEDRVWNCSPYIGLGWGRVWDAPQSKEVTANIGIMNSFRVLPALDLNLDVRGMYVHDRFDGELGGRSGDGLLTVTVGLTYRFKQRGWERSRTIVYHNEKDLQALRDALNEMAAENKSLREMLSNTNTGTSATIIKKIAAGNLVVFKINRSELSNEARVNLGMLAEIIKEADPGAVYTITGYADAGTGNKKINERLSIERAQAVYDCLTKEFGVNPAQLKTEHKGGVDNMFYNDPRLSRAVITRSE
ncbi:MAG: OmpA family protein [Prevotellaceae bacterium]|nr:OmpA family protein [Prevotellaceae bacterium]